MSHSLKIEVFLFSVDSFFSYIEQATYKGIQMLYALNLERLIKKNENYNSFLDGNGVLLMEATDAKIWSGVCAPGTLVGYVKRLEDGVYETPGHNFNIEIKQLGLRIINEYQHRFSVGIDVATSDENRHYLNTLQGQWDSECHGELSSKIFGDYGVCDNHKQLLALIPELHTSEKKFVVACCTVRKSEQPKCGGWRYEKWGPYIGIQNPTCEYLADEEHINEVVLYHIYEIE